MTEEEARDLKMVPLAEPIVQRLKAIEIAGVEATIQPKMAGNLSRIINSLAKQCDLADQMIESERKLEEIRRQLRWCYWKLAGHVALLCLWLWAMYRFYL